ncbi:MAG: DUF502 domain-containing protein [Alphaproteobacteria bacterium]|nr:DUF502 domain-containing protein [Alphaproteobacteria bacterium]
MDAGPNSERTPFFHANIQGNLVAGILAVAPLIAVWLVFDFFLNALSDAGRPLAVGLTEFLDERVPVLAPILADHTVRWLIAVMAALLSLYSIGAIASRVIGRRIIDLFEKIITRIPLVQTVYSAAKSLTDVLRQSPGGAERVVLIEFPHPGLKTLAFVMRTFRDAATGEDLATVFVPTAPNPTTGYLEILPVSKLVPTDIPAEQAMAMILSGGAIAPSRLSVKAPSRAP